MIASETVSLVNRIIEENRQNIVDAVIRLVKIPSKKAEPAKNAPFGPECARALNEGLALAGELGFATTNLDNYIGWAEMGEGDTMLGVLSHLDVVPEGDGWTLPPYEGVVKDGRIYGRGTQDDKGPAVASMFALKAVLDAGCQLNKRVRLIFGSDEESGSGDIDYYKQHAQDPDLTFSPDADYPLVNGEKGIMRIGLTADFARSEALPKVISMTGGERPNIVVPVCTAVVAGIPAEQLAPICEEIARETRVSVALEEKAMGKAVPEVTITVTGKGAHGATPHIGINAATALTAMLNALPLADCAQIRALQELGKVIPHGDTLGEHLGAKRSDEISGDMTCNLGIFRLDGTHLDVTVDVRYPITAKSEEICAAMSGALSALTLEKRSDAVPHYVSPDSPLVQGLLKAYTETTGREGYCMTIGGGTYARSFQGGVSFGCLFPDGVDNMHQADEYMPIDELILNTKILARALMELACD